MKLKTLLIRVLPGLDPGFEVNFDPGAVNVITGPNASGKSSLVRAVRAMLYPDSQSDYCELRAEWQRGNQTLISERRGYHVNWLADGQTVDSPRLPPADAAGAFLIHAEDLNALGSTDEHIATHLRTLLAGGYDLEAVRQEKALKPPARPKKLAQDFAHLEQAVNAKEAEYVALNDELANLDRLRRQLEKTADAAGQLRAIEDALALADAIAERNALEQTLIQEFPGGMDRLRGDEVERLKQADDKLSQRTKELSIAKAALDKTGQQLKQSGNVDPQTLEALQAELADDRDRLSELEQRIEQQRERKEQRRSALKIAARRLGPIDGLKTDELLKPKLDQAALEEFEKRVDRVHGMREQIRSLSGELARTHVSSNRTGRTQDDLRSARQALLQWLEGARTSPLEGVLWSGLSLASGLAAWRLLGPQDLEPLPELIMLILIALGVPLSLLVNFALRWRDREQAVKDFAETDIEPPLGWTEEEVESRLERMDLELESATRHEISQARASEVRQQLNTQRSKLDQARTRLDTLAKEIGVSAETRLETGFLLWCRHLYEWQRQQLSLASTTTQLKELEARYEVLKNAVGERLKRHGFDLDEPDQALSESGSNGGSRSLAAIVHQLTPRMRRNAELHNESIANEHRINELAADIEQLKAARDPIFIQAGLKPDDRDGLMLRADQFKAWHKIDQDRRDQTTEIGRLEARLVEEPKLIKLAQDQAREQLERRQTELAAKVAERDQINQRVGEIQTRHQDVLERRELEQLTNESTQTRVELQQSLNDHLLSAAAGLLIDDVRAAHQSSNEPAALTQAGRWFERFTRHRYRLRFHNDHFSALDTHDSLERSIAELSTGTRVQLLLAVRLAWIERLEDQIEPLPVFMDEVLTTTDPDRYQAVVASVQELVEDGRQMFYLTAQRDDAAAWTEWAGDGPIPHLVDMAKVRAEHIEPLKLTMPTDAGVDRAPAEIPDPSVIEQGEMEMGEWAAAVGVDAVAPWNNAGALHVFHILQDQLEQVTELVRYELSRVGELESFLSSAQARKLISADESKRLEQRIQAARLILEDWRLRHNRPVDARALLKSDAISDHFMDRVQELNSEVNGDPTALLECLRDGKVSRFRSDNTDQLESWLQENGYFNASQTSEPLGSARISLKSGLEPETVARLRDWIIAAVKDPLSDH